MCQEKNEIAGKVHAIIDKFAERGLRSLGVAYQVFFLSMLGVGFIDPKMVCLVNKLLIVQAQVVGGRDLGRVLEFEP